MKENKVKVVVRKSNGLGTAGFVMSLIGLVFCWVPVFGVVFIGLGAVFSALGLIVGIVGRKPKGLSFAGLVIVGLFVVLALTLLQGIVDVFNMI